MAASSDYTKFNNVTQIGQSLLMSQLESNLKTYLDWAFLAVGGFSNAETPASGAYGGTFDRLRPVQDLNYTNGQVWEGPRKDWVWETGVEYTSQPTNISGVYIGGTLYGTGDATYGHHYNYPLGRVVFDSAISTNSTVQLEHSYRNVQVYIADQAPWWDELQYDSFRVDDSTLLNAGSGNWQILGNHRVQMPAVVVEAVPRRTFKPYEMGNVGQYVYQDVLFHILAESRWFRNNLVDTLSLQPDRTLWMFDVNTATGLYPLDFRGMRVTNPTMYPDLLTIHPYKKVRYYNTVVSEMATRSSRLYEGTVRVTFEIVVT